MINKHLLKARCNAPYVEIAKVLGCTPTTVSNKARNYKGADFTLGEMRTLVREYHISNEQIIELFFNDVDEVDECR